MSLRFDTVAINVQDLQKSQNFWKEALGFVVEDESDDWITLIDPQRGGVKLALQLTDHPKQGLNRIHFDLDADDAPAEVERLKSLGAIIIPWPHYDAYSNFLVMTDPEGNEFCVAGKNLDSYRKEFGV